MLGDISDNEGSNLATSLNRCLSPSLQHCALRLHFVFNAIFRICNFPKDDNERILNIINLPLDPV